MTVNVKGMDIWEYLSQGDYWIDAKTSAVFQVSAMKPDQRLRAARCLARLSTALICIAESQAANRGELVTALRLANERPREWMIHTVLYRALYPEPPTSDVQGTNRGTSDNRAAVSSVVPMYGVPEGRSA